jgi:predicted nucleotidyltransferase
MKLPEKTRDVLGRIIEDLKSRESVSGIALFGSRSRGDADTSSDVDLLVVDSKDFDYQYVERAEIDSCLVDFDYVPEKWLLKSIPPEIDQKLFEAEVLYDRKGALTNAKISMSKNYWEPERVDIRAEAYLMDADTYFTRAKAAYNKDDFQSAKVNASLATEALMRILIELGKMPISNSRYIVAFEDSAKRLGMHKLYEDYLEIAGFSGLDRAKTVNTWDSFSALWRKSVNFVESNPSTLKTLHVKVRNNLSYYGKESFLKGMLVRTKTLIENGLFTEAAHYMTRTSADMLENYAWLVSVMEGTRFDYSSLFQRLKGSKTSPKEIYDHAVETFGVKSVTSKEAEETLNRVKEILLNIRQKRRELIASHFQP